MRATEAETLTLKSLIHRMVNSMLCLVPCLSLVPSCRCDTFFLATCYTGSEDDGGSQGCDVSHRGGDPGFIDFQAPGTLRWADYDGNYTFTSLGTPGVSLLCCLPFASSKVHRAALQDAPFRTWHAALG